MVVALCVAVLVVLGGWRPGAPALNGGLAAPAGAVAAADAAAAQRPLVRVAVAGDVGTADRQEAATAAAMAGRGAAGGWDALLLLGDNVYDNGDPTRTGPAVTEPFREVLRPGTALLAALGNHDVRDGNGPGQLRALRQPGSWFARRVGPLLVVVLDSNRPDDPEQLAFLEQTLRTSDATWTVAAMHHPMFSAGYHGSSLDVRDAFAPVLTRYRVPLVLAGHDHDYQRTRQLAGTTYLVSGAAAKLRPAGHDVDTVVSTSTRHFLDIAVHADPLVVRAVDQQQQTFDGLVLCEPPHRPPLPS